MTDTKCGDAIGRINKGGMSSELCNLLSLTVPFSCPQFQEDHTFMLILRLRHNVIKTGLRAIALSYSRISLADVAAKLTLGSREDAEFIVAKAIRDGVIEVSCGEF